MLVNIKNFCTQHGYTLHTAHTQGVHHMSFLSTMPLWTLILGGIAGAYVAKVGVSAVWTSLKNDYSSIRNMFSGSQTTSTPTPASTPTA